MLLCLRLFMHPTTPYLKHIFTLKPPYNGEFGTMPFM